MVLPAHRPLGVSVAGRGGLGLLTGASDPPAPPNTLVAKVGRFSFHGDAMTPAFSVGADLAAFVLSGIAAAFAQGTVPVLSAAAGAFVLTGIAAGLVGANTLAAQPGTFVETGVAAGLNISMPAALGTFALTGIAATLTSAGGSSAAGTTQTITFNPSDIGVNGVLANGNRDFTGPGVTNPFTSCRCTIGASTGKKHIEFKLTLVGGTGINVGIGLANGSASLTTFFGNTGNTNSAMVYWGSNSDFAAGITKTNAITPGTSVLNDVYSLDIDHDAGKAWLAKNNVYYNGGDPAAGTNPWLTFSAGTYFPGATQNNGTPGGTVQIPATTTFNAPSGFTVY